MWTDAHSNMTVVETSIGKVVASAKHSIATGTVGRVEYAYADELEMGHELIAMNGSAVRVVSTGVQAAAGFYSPLTYSSNFFVGSSADSVVLAHGFAHNPAPVFSAHVVHALMNIAESWPRLGGLVRHVGARDRAGAAEKVPAPSLARRAGRMPNRQHRRGERGFPGVAVVPGTEGCRCGRRCPGPRRVRIERVPCGAGAAAECAGHARLYPSPLVLIPLCVYDAPVGPAPCAWT
ncbi:unnamed protein product [Prorocentrum cordatum]|uniref:Uncharacterized protein n=1 Tax=Prorocentrum cordatum TaxID=2364126 RepID=A0ABN9WA81_9DINO|nr:unnamed protein product [Polarella glacialis]